MKQAGAANGISVHGAAMAVLAAALLLTSCGSEADPVSPVTTIPPPATTLPGEAIDIGPQAGDIVAVVGVPHDDLLDVYSAPSSGDVVIAALGPLADGLVATGRARLVSESIWYEVTVGDATGWADSAFLAFLADTDDAASEIVDLLGRVPSAGTMAELGQLVAEAVASIEPPSVITMAVAPTVGDFGEITYDVLGLGDDAVFGMRLHVFGQPDGEGFALYSVERTWLCGRGVTEAGLCI